MILRHARFDDLAEILRLYTLLNPGDPRLDPNDEDVRNHWQNILNNTRLRYYVIEMSAGPSGQIAEHTRTDSIVKLISTCTLTLIPNLTRGMRPYGVIENVVTDTDYRGQGHATRLLRHTLDEAWKEGCYKVMLSTGSKRESTLRFYEKAGFKRGVRTGFVAHPYRVKPPSHGLQTMPFTIQLCLSDAEVLTLRSAFVDLESSIVARGDRPHLSLAVFDASDEASVVEATREFAANIVSLSLTLAGVGLFPSSEHIVYLAPVVTKELLNLHEDLWHRLQSIGAQYVSYYTPQNWVPHLGVYDRSESNKAN